MRPFPQRWRRGSSFAHSGESHVRESYLAQRRLTVRVALLVTPPWDALIVATIFRLPLVVAIVNLADELPERIVTVAGTLARNGWLLDKFTTIPPDGATALSVTVPIEEAPPATMVGLSVKAARTADAGGNTLIEADFVTPL